MKECLPCLRYNVEKEGYHPAKSVIAYQPWDHVEIDLIGPLQVSERGSQYILTIVDVCTTFTLLRAIPNKEMECVARTLWECFCDFGTPRILQSDNGSEFVNNVVRTLTVIYGIDHRLSAAYHPSTNGLVERRNKDIGQVLKKFVEGTYAAWDEWLPMVQISLNVSIGNRLKSSGFALMFNHSFNNFKDFSKVQQLMIEMKF